MKLLDVFILFLILHSSTFLISVTRVPNTKLNNNITIGATTFRVIILNNCTAGSKSIITFMSKFILTLF